MDVWPRAIQATINMFCTEVGAQIISGNPREIEIQWTHEEMKRSLIIDEVDGTYRLHIRAFVGHDVGCFRNTKLFISFPVARALTNSQLRDAYTMVNSWNLKDLYYRTY